MKRLIFPLLILFSLLVSIAFALDSVEAPGSCQYCGMDRTKFAHSRMLIEYDDQTATGTCSLHCAAIDLANNIDKTPTAIKVADLNSKELIEAESATWVIGGDKGGVMSARAKWAFTAQAEAEAFMNSHQGVIGTFEDAMKAAYEDMYQDTKMIREKRKAKRMKNG